MTLRVDIGWDRPNSTGDSEHWLSVSFSKLESPETPASIAVLVDISSSMVGDRLTQAREAIASLISACFSTDQIAVFSFASEVRQLFESKGGEDVAERLRGLTAGGKTRLDLALPAAATWLGACSGARHLVLLTDGDPTDAEGRRAPVEPLIEEARAFGRLGVRAAVVGLGRVDSYDPAFLRSFADACAGTAFVGVPPGQLVERTLAALRDGQGATDVSLTLESAELDVLEAWRVAPRVQPLPLRERTASIPAAEGGGILLRCRFIAPIGAARGVRAVGTLRVAGSASSNATVPLTLSLVSPTSPERNALNADIDRMRVRVELARTAALRAASDDLDEQVRLTRRLSDLVEHIQDPRATMRVSQELRQLASGEPLDRDTREEMVEDLRGGD